MTFNPYADNLRFLLGAYIMEDVIPTAWEVGDQTPSQGLGSGSSLCSDEVRLPAEALRHTGCDSHRLGDGTLLMASCSWLCSPEYGCRACTLSAVCW